MADRLRTGIGLLARYLLTLWLAVTGLFLAMVALKGNPVSLYIDPRLSPELITRLERIYGYDAGHVERYFRMMGNLARGELGVSFTHKQPVRELLGPAGRRSLVLAGASLSLALLLALILLAAHARIAPPSVRRVARGLVTTSLTMPPFVVGAMLLSLVATRIDWLPQFGTAPLFDEPGDWPGRVRHLILPALSLAIPMAGQLAAYLSEHLARLEHAPFVISARGRGVSGRRIFWNHQLRLMLPEVAQLLGLYLPALAGGVIIIESLFGWSGIGLLLIDAAGAHDYPLLIGGCLWCAVFVIPGYELADRFRETREVA